MEYAIDLITGETTSAEQALHDRLTLRETRGYQCATCLEDAFLRSKGKGERPFFCHYPHSPVWCPNKTGSEEWSNVGGDGSNHTYSLADYVLRELSGIQAVNITQIRPETIDRNLAKFLSAGVDQSNPDDVNDRLVAAINENALRLLYQPRFVVLLRWICALIEENPEVPQTTPTELARSVRRICLVLPFVSAWRNRRGSHTTLTAMSRSSVSLGQGADFWYAQDLGGSNCFIQARERRTIVEISSFPATLRIFADYTVSISMIRHSLEDNHGHLPEVISIGPSGYHLYIPHSQGIIISPNYSLGLTPARHPLLYIVPANSWITDQLTTAKPASVL